MALVTVTATKIDFQSVSSLKRGIPAQNVENLRPSTEGNLATAAIFELNKGNGVKETWYVTETYADLLVDLNNALAEQGAELASNKVTSVSGASTDVQYPSAKLLYDQLALKAPLASPTLTGTPVAPTAGVSINDTQIATTAFAQGRGKTPFGTSASAADTYVVVLAPAIATSAGSPLSGTRILLKCTNANTGAATLEVTGSTGAIAIVRRDGSTALSAADLPAGKYVPMFYDGTSWVCENVG